MTCGLSELKLWLLVLECILGTHNPSYDRVSYTDIGHDHVICKSIDFFDPIKRSLNKPIETTFGIIALSNSTLGLKSRGKTQPYLSPLLMKNLLVEEPFTWIKFDTQEMLI